MNAKGKSIIPLLLSVLVIAIVGLSLIAVPVAAAGHDAALVQQASNGCNPCSLNPTITVSFPRRVTARDVVVVAVINANPKSCGCVGAFLPTDSLGSSYAEATSLGTLSVTVELSFTTLSSSGADTITVRFLSSSPSIPPAAANVYVYEVSGVSTKSAVSKASVGYGLHSPTSTTSTAFAPGAFLIAAVETGTAITTFTPGTGFSLSHQTPATRFGGAEFAISGVSSHTTFPASFSPPGIAWGEVSTEFEQS